MGIHPIDGRFSPLPPGTPQGLRPLRLGRTAFWGILGLLLFQEALAQVVGERAEMERLRTKAEDAIANGDADGAAMNSGKAALMAAHLAKQSQDEASAGWYRGAESLFRAQEHAYRALALFQRAGGQAPASTGVCQSMLLAQQEIRNAGRWFEQGGPSSGEAPPPDSGLSLKAMSEEWGKTIEGMTADFQCQ